LVNHRGLAGAVRTNDGPNLAGRAKRKREIVDGGKACKRERSAAGRESQKEPPKDRGERGKSQMKETESKKRGGKIGLDDEYMY